LKRVKSNDQLESTSTLLFVAWKLEGYNALRARVRLIECNKAFRWRKVDLKEYHQIYANQLWPYTDPIQDTWLISDGTVLLTKLESDFTQRDGVLNLTISEGIRGDRIRRPVWIGPEM
jgi:hypothetical protein